MKTDSTKSKIEYEVFDTACSEVIGTYKHRSSAVSRRNKELKNRDLPPYFIIIRRKTMIETGFFGF